MVNRADYSPNGVQATETFLNSIWRPDDPLSRNYYGCITPEDIYRNVFCDLGTPDTDASALEQFHDVNVWFCPVLFWQDTNRQRSSIAGTWCFWVDVDDDETSDITDLETLLENMPLDPSIVVESSPGRFHVYWLLTEFVRDKEQIQKINTSLSQSVHNADISGWDAAQLLRLPLGTNKKARANGHKPSIVFFEPDRLYDPEYLASNLPEPQGNSWRMTASHIDVEMPESELDWEELPNGLSSTHVDLLKKGAPQGKRSEAVYTVVLALDDKGVEPDNIAGFLYKSPLASKFNRNESRITQEVSRILSKGKGDGTPTSVPTFDKEANANLPLEFWESRESLRLIRQAAHSRCASADAVLGNVLARFSSMMKFTVNLDTGISEAPLNMFVIVLGGTGTGKGESSKASKDLLRLPPHLTLALAQTPYVDGQSIGSGEGIAEAFMGMASIQDPNTGQVFKVRTQVRHNVFLVADEGRAFATQADRSGATLTPVICSAWSGSALGQANATEERTRFIAGNSYSLGISIGFQPATVMPVIDQISTGLPQRFLWLSATDGTIPENPIEPPHIPLDGILYEPTGNVTFADSIKAELWNRKRKQSTGELKVPENRSQEPLMRAKIAALLALIDGRSHVDETDWHLSEIMFETSLKVMDSAISYHRYEAAKKRNQYREELAQTEERTEIARTQAPVKLERIAKNIYKQLTEKDRFIHSDIRKAIAHKDRHLFDSALDHAIAQGWVIEVESGKRYKPGISPDN